MAHTKLIGRTLGSSSSLVFFAFFALIFVSSPSPVSAQSAPLSQSFTVSQTTDGFPYMAGGFGTDERQLMVEQSGKYNLKLIFAEKAGIYMADTRVVIENEKGEEVLNMRAPGPWLYVQLPPGTYNVTASFEGNSKTIKNIPVSKSQQISRIFHWDVAGEPEHPQLISKSKDRLGLEQAS